MFDEKIVLQSATGLYGYSVLNPDGSLIGGGSTSSTPYTMLAYYDNTGVTYNYSYYIEATPGTLTTTAQWRCFRVEEDKDGNFISKKWAGKAFNNLGDETTVKGLTYN